MMKVQPFGGVLVQITEYLRTAVYEDLDEIPRVYSEVTLK